MALFNSLSRGTNKGELNFNVPDESSIGKEQEEKKSFIPCQIFDANTQLTTSICCATVILSTRKRDYIMEELTI